MSRKKEKKREKRDRSRPVGDPQSAAPYEVSERTLWILTGMLVVVYFIFSFISKGFYQDDEIAHYDTAYMFWKDPFSILTYWSRPGFKILFVIPALLGIKYVHFVGAVIGAATAYFASLLARQYGLRNRILVLVLCGFQPLFYQISFRTYAEILGACLLTLMILSYEKKQYIWVAVISSYLFAVRQEFVFLSLIVGALFLLQKRWIPFLLLAWMPVLLGVIGWLKTGNLFWLTEVFLAGGKNPGFFKPGFFQYFKAFAPIFGTVVAGLFLVGFFGLSGNRFRVKEALGRYHALYITFVVLFLANSVLASDLFNISAGQGVWRYILPVSPLVALFALIGFNRIWGGDESERRRAYVLIFLWTLLVVALFSHKHNYYGFLEATDYLGFYALLGLIGLMVLGRSLGIGTRTVVIATALLTIVYAVQSEPPLPVSEENLTIQTAVEWWRTNGFEDRPVAANHIMFFYYAGIHDRDSTMHPGLTLRAIREAKPGSVILWDSHYSFRPEYGTDAPFDSVRSNPSLRFLRQFVSSNQRFGLVAFEKLPTPSSD